MRSRVTSLIAISLAAVALRAPLALGYVQRLTTTDSTGAPLVNAYASSLQFLMNSQLVAGLQSSASGKNVTVLAANSDPVGAARNALATWNGVGANVKFLPLQSTDTIAAHAIDNSNVILLATNANDVSAVGSALAVTLNTFYIASGVVNGVR